MTADSLPGETAVGRVALTVTDLARAVEFYRSVVALAVISEREGQAVLGAGGRPLLVLDHDPDAPERSREAAGLFHTAFRVPDRAAPADALARVESESDLAGASDHRVSEALYLWDPEGNSVEIYCDRPREEWPIADGRVQMDMLGLDLDDLRTEASGVDSVPVDTDIGHVHLEVTSLDGARTFYVDRLGLDVRQELNGALFAAAAEYHHHVGLNRWNGRSEPASGRGLAWVELLVPDDETLTAVRERLAGSGIGVTDTDDGIAVTDPDGIGVHFAVAEA